MATQTERTDEARLMKAWQAQGLTEYQADDLIGIARELATATNRPLNQTLGQVDDQVGQVLEAKLLGRVHDVVNYGSDLGKS